MAVDQKFDSFAIFATMRSGSNLLERLVNQFGGLHCYGELFNKGFIGKSGQFELSGVSKAERDANPGALLGAIRDDNPETIPGYRIFADHDKSMFQTALNDPRCAKIILRRDPIDSFVSLQIARKTDQWLIHEVKDRKAAQVHFSTRDYKAYLAGLAAFYQQIDDVLDQNNHDHFNIEYGQLADLDSLNALAKFIGATAPLEKLEEPIKRQNPGALVDKIMNYDEVREALNLPVASPNIVLSEQGTPLSRVYFSEALPLAFAPVPGALWGGVKHWMQQFGAVENGYTQGRYHEWLNTHAKPIVFSVAYHPVERAYAVYMQKIFGVGPGTYAAIREKMGENYGVIMPEPALVATNDRQVLEMQNYGATEHRTGFKQFLAFLQCNLNGETELRQDGKWMRQVDILDQYADLSQDIQIFHGHNLRHGLTYLANRLNQPSLPPSEQPVTFLYPLAEIYDAEIEALAAQVYPEDYQRFGFSALSGL